MWLSTFLNVLYDAPKDKLKDIVVKYKKIDPKFIEGIDKRYFTMAVAILKEREDKENNSE